VNNTLCEPNRAATRERQATASGLVRLEAAAGHLRPPVPVDRLADVLGFRVVLLRDAPDEISGLLSARERLIGVNGRHHPHRRRFTLGHELGHVLLGHPPESRCCAEQIRAFNLEADRCASDLLIPFAFLRSFLQRGTPPAGLARIFDVSAEAMTAQLDRLRRGPAGR
jgi:Zn-dependent peptidase ImmA (M78 family)